MELPTWLNIITSLGGLISTLVTAVATIFLWLVTKTLAAETKRMVDASSQPHIVATIDPNQWSMMHADLNVDNTGNAAAYDIQISFDPPIENGGATSTETIIPFQNISVLKPGQGLSSYLSEFHPLIGKSYTVTISWRRDPAKDDRETNTYILNMRDKDGLSQLGDAVPLIQVANQIKKIQEHLGAITSGSRKLQADIFTSGDRAHEQSEQARLRQERLQRVNQQPKESN